MLLTLFGVAVFGVLGRWQVHAEGVEDYQTPEGIRASPALALLRTLV